MKKGFSFADFLEELKNGEADILPKPVEERDERIYFLIVCEGEKTEPNYFNYFKRQLPKNLLSTVELVGEGDNTINVVQKAIIERDKRISDPINPNYDEIWAVFDKDDFPDVRVNQAVQLADSNDVSCAFSNQAFELWYVLHFQYLDADLHRKQYFKILSEILGTNYEKNSLDIVELIFKKGSLDLAISSAIKLEALNKGKSASASVPYTSVYKLVEKLKAYCILE